MFFDALIKGLALGLLLAISVGPIVFTIIKQSIANGHKGGLIFISGVFIGDLGLVIAANAATQFFNSFMSHEKVIGIGGSIFLMGLGIYTFFFKKSEETEPKKTYGIKESDHWKLLGIFFSGFLMNLLNPGVFLFWFAASATILEDSKRWIHQIDFRIIVFATCLLFNLGFDVFKVFFAGKIRTKLTPHNIHIINRISGLILMVFSVVLIYRLYTGHIGHKM